MKKKVSLVVGGSRGIGQSISNFLKKRGDVVFILSSNSIKKNRNYIKLDLNDNKQITHILKSKFKNFKIDNIIFSQRYRGVETKKHFEVDLFSTINILSNLKNNLNNSSSIIFISSISNRTIVDDQDLEYHIIKSGTEQMMRYYAVRFSKKKIRFNCILPSRVIKNSNKKFYFKNKKGIKIRKLIESITPLKRMGTSKDIANLVLFLTDKKSDYITGQSFVVDGGLSLMSQESIFNKYKSL